MTSLESDAWTRWYDTYLADRAALRAARLLAQDRRRVANLAAGLLLAYMIAGGVLASLAVGLVMTH